MCLSPLLQEDAETGCGRFSDIAAEFATIRGIACAVRTLANSATTIPRRAYDSLARNRPPERNIPPSHGWHHSIRTLYSNSRVSLASLIRTSPTDTDPL